MTKHVQIDWNIVDELLLANCSGEQVAAEFGVHADTLYRRVKEEKGMNFAAFAATRYRRGEGQILKGQYNAAMNGNWHALAYLGKVRLKQVEAKAEPVNELIPAQRAVISLEKDSQINVPD